MIDELAGYLEFVDCGGGVIDDRRRARIRTFRARMILVVRK